MAEAVASYVTVCPLPVMFVIEVPDTTAPASFARWESAVTAKRDEVAYRITALFLEAERAARLGSLARKAVESQQTVLDTVHAQVAEGRALPLAEKQAALALARARAGPAGITRRGFRVSGVMEVRHPGDGVPCAHDLRASRVG